MSGDILEEARAKIDAEITALQERIRSLRSSRNALSPIHHLPHEVMTQIFMWVQLLYRGYLGQGVYDAATLPQWIRVTHVSQHWRTVALGCKALYSTILTYNLKYSKEILKLSGSAPLTLLDGTNWVTDKLWESQDLQDLVAIALPRVRNVYIGEKGLQFILPRIETLDLALEDLCIHDCSSVSAALFPRSLRYLRLDDYNEFSGYEWLSRLSNMVELSLVADHDQERIPVNLVLDILNGMPSLISLELGSILDSTTTQVKARPVTPKLQYLRLEDTPDLISQLLPSLTFAHRFIMNLDMGTIPGDSTDWVPTLFGEVGSRIQASSMTLRTAECTREDHYPYGAKMVFSELEGSVKNPCLRLRAYAEEEDFPQSWSKGVEALPLDGIQSLTVDATLDVEYWKASPWHRVHTLQQLILLKEKTSSAFLEYLIVTEIGRSSGVSMPFKSLEELSLHDIHYGRDVKSKVQAVLTKRTKKRGTKMRKLGFYDCSISADSLRMLHKVADVVEQQGEKKKTKKRNKSP